MVTKRVFVAGAGLVALLILVAAHQIAAAPAATVPLTRGPVHAEAGPVGKAVRIVATPVAVLPTPVPTPVVGPSPAPAGSLAALAQTIARAGGQIGATPSGQVSAAQMQQAMGQLATAAGQEAELALRANDGTADLRQMAALTLSQEGLLAARLRDASAKLQPTERAQAFRQMQVLSLDVAQTVEKAGNISGQSSVDDRQSVMEEMQQLLGAMRSISDHYRSAMPGS